MSIHSIQRLALVLTFAVLTTSLVGCSKGVSGKYADDSGVMNIEFKSGKAYLTTAGSTKVHEATYTEEGDKITMKDGAESHVITKNSDGTLAMSEGPMKITLKKK